MSWFNLSSDREADDILLEALSAIGGGAPVLVSRGWMGVDKVTGELVDEPPAQVELETLRRPGAYGFDMNMYGPSLPAMSTAAFARALAIASERSLLFSDCHANPWTWLLAEPDGAIRHVWQSTELTADGEETFDLAAGVEVWPLVIAPGESLPPVMPDCADGLPQGCGTSGDAKCVVFQTNRCPQPTQYGMVRRRD